MKSLRWWWTKVGLLLAERLQDNGATKWIEEKFSTSREINGRKSLSGCEWGAFSGIMIKIVISITRDTSCLIHLWTWIRPRWNLWTGWVSLSGGHFGGRQSWLVWSLICKMETWYWQDVTGLPLIKTEFYSPVMGLVCSTSWVEGCSDEVISLVTWPLLDFMSVAVLFWGVSVVVGELVGVTFEKLRHWLLISAFLTMRITFLCHCSGEGLNYRHQRRKKTKPHW